MNIDDIIARYTEDRQALSDEEYAFLIARIQDDPELAAHVKHQLVMDDMLSRANRTDRGHFLEQVTARLKAESNGTDFVHRTIHRARKRRSANRRPALRWLVPAAAAALMALAVFLLRPIDRPSAPEQMNDNRPVLAQIASVQGEVVLRRDGRFIPAENGTEVRDEDGIAVGRAGFARLAFEGGALLACREDSETVLQSAPDLSFPEIHVRSGEVFFSGPTLNGARRITTGHAAITLVSTQVDIVAYETFTTLAMAHGRARLTTLRSDLTVELAEGTELSAAADDMNLSDQIRPADIAGRLAWLAPYGVVYNTPPYTPPPEPAKAAMAVVQVALDDPVNPETNLPKVEALVRRAAMSGARLILLPALSFASELTDEKGMLGSARPADGPLVQRMQALAAELKIFIGFGLRVTIDSRTTANSALFLDDTGRVILVQRKIELASHEAAFTAAGERTLTAVTPFGRIIMLISKDVHCGDTLVRAAALDPDLVLVLNCDEEYPRYHALLSQTACRKRCTVLMANHVFDRGKGGHSAVFTADGGRRDIIPPAGEGILSAEVPVPR